MEDRPANFYEKYKKTLLLKIINLKTPSSTRSCNEGARVAKGDVLCFLDDKVVGDETLIEEHLMVMEEEKVDVVHGAIFHPDRYGEVLSNEFSWKCYQEDLDPVMIFMISANCKWQGMTIGVYTANMSVKKETYWQVDGMDEKISGQYNDVEFAYRLFRAGAKMFYSSRPLIRNKRVCFGGAYTKNLLLLTRFRPTPHSNCLYFHMKHLSGWTYNTATVKAPL